MYLKDIIQYFFMFESCTIITTTCYPEINLFSLVPYQSMFTSLPMYAFHRNGIVCQEAFRRGVLSLRIMFSKHMHAVVCIHSILLLREISLHGYTTFCGSVDRLIDMWVILYH